MIKYILFIALYLIGFGVHAQTDSTRSKESPLNKNSFYLGLGAGTEFYFTGTFTYERLLWQRKKAVHFAIGANIGYSYYAVWGIGGSVISANLLLLTGANKSHIEISGGANFILNGDLEGYGPYKFSTSVGYRFQKPEGGFLFRIGTGWPEVGYIGLGHNF